MRGVFFARVRSSPTLISLRSVPSNLASLVVNNLDVCVQAESKISGFRCLHALASALSEEPASEWLRNTIADLFGSPV
jgi:hypothetical protein